MSRSSVWNIDPEQCVAYITIHINNNYFMKNITNVFKSSRRSFIGASVVLSAALIAMPFVASAEMLTRQLQLGMSGGDVSTLQTYLASNNNVYPSGLVTGYFGQLTKAAVERFQANEGIVSAGTSATTGYGRVGPATIAAINSHMNGDGSSPWINPVSVSVTGQSATLAWNTNENASAVVYYGTSPLSMTEGSPTNGVTIGGYSMLVHTDLRTSHSATLTSLNANTVYYYVVYVKDGAGNESVTWPAVFQTSN